MIKREMSSLRKITEAQKPYRPSEKYAVPATDPMVIKTIEALKSIGFKWVDPPVKRDDGKIMVSFSRVPYDVLVKVATHVGDNFAVSAGTGGGFITWQPTPNKIKL